MFSGERDPVRIGAANPLPPELMTAAVLLICATFAGGAAVWAIVNGDAVATVACILCAALIVTLALARREVGRGQV